MESSKSQPASTMTDDAERILVVEDDEDIADLVELHLGDLGYEVELVDDGTVARDRALENDYALLILDIMLPGMDGFDVCKQVRAEKPSLPILMLTAKSEEVDKVLGLELGADDYLTKPFSIRELLARVKAIFRRVEVDQETAQSAERSPVRFDELVVDPDKHKVTLGGEKVDLTKKEFELLHLFIRNPGRTFDREELLDKVWGYQYTGYSHTVNTHINRLRNKIEKDPSNPRYVKTVWGVGYRFAEREEIAQSSS